VAKVLHVIASMDAGGAERVVAEYARWHDRSRYEPTVCCVLTGGPLADALERDGVPVHVLGRRTRLDVRAVWRLARLISRERFDVVHNHNFTALALGFPAAVLGRARALVRTEHNVFRTPGLVRHWVSRIAAFREDAQIGVSDVVVRTHVRSGRVSPARFVTVRNGISADRMRPVRGRDEVRAELGLPADAVVCINVGSLTEQKNRANLVDALARLKDLEKLRALVVGAGPEEEKIRKQLDASGLTDRVMLLGERLDVPDLLAASDVFVLSSDWEGLPITLLEAMSAGVPCVSTAVGGVREAIEDGVTGLTVPPRDPGALADALRSLMTDPARRSAIAAAARDDFARRFRAEQMVRQTESLYDMALAGTAGLADGGRIKVLYVIGQLGRGGAERQTAELVKRLPKGLFDPVVCCLHGPEVLGEEIEDAGIRVIYLEKKKGLFSGATSRLAGVIRRERPAVVHSYLFSANWRSLLAGRLMRVPLIISSVRNVDIHSKKSGLVFEWLLSGLTDRVIANAGAVRDHVARAHRIREEKIDVVYNGINLARIDGPASPGEGPSCPPGAGCVAMIASLSRKKDHATFLRAAAIVLKQLPDARFLVVGDGPLRSSIAKRVSSMGLSDSVELTGPTDDIATLLAGTDVSVLTSLKEGCSNVVLESMAAGVPLVVTDVGGNRELVDPGRTGYLLPTGDAEGIAARIVELLRDPDLRRTMGEAGRERVRERYTADRMVEHTVDIYMKILKVRAHGLEEWARRAGERDRAPREASAHDSNHGRFTE
jgi:glycosyltransferase involved in cell wall biosynthesis